MKSFLLIILLFLFASHNGQITKGFDDCKTNGCKAKESFKASKYYLEIDSINLSQKWLDITKNHHPENSNDALSFHILSLQSEIFYYVGLSQFGNQEAKKAVKKARFLKDSLLISDAYFFEGLELGKNNDAEKSFRLSLNFYPKNPKKSLFETVGNEHILNNISQLKRTIGEADSALYYNQKAYDIALKKNSKRAIANCEQTFGEIYQLKGDLIQSNQFFLKSIESARRFRNFDVALLSYGLLLKNEVNNPKVCKNYFNQGETLIEQQNINLFFRRTFYEYALQAFEKMNSSEDIRKVQSKIIALVNEEKSKNNVYIQDISNQYIKNENKLLNLEIEKLKRKRKISVLQLLVAGLAIVIMALTIIIFRRKNKIQQKLLQQKTDISKDLHDDIGSGLGSILIHSELLSSNKISSEQQQKLSSKIYEVGKEISQKLNTFIWSLSNENNDLRNFCEYVFSYANNLTEETDIKLICTKSKTLDLSKELDGQIRKNLFFCIKEILNNSLKYSSAKTIKISVNIIDKKTLEVIISDNGTGLTKENQFGNGITNIKNRIKNLNGNVSFQNNNGLTAIITVPI
ncbi:signal transduction histidine kinase [Epilithonimonas hungarica]|uniref:tetratricopeptide repeat-containing sensor histidine kinase n=1 Tax=Epilithonimonas hungarica TaxID=454006 RepID=UPI0027889FAF|nr:tetratricopeptide repeat-containing sensor histidine kinase [Epilithonimonas hungarica]MDP9955670.1 signal transduction histidine kinase [Epilithonimonas hungarica]